MGVHNTTGVDNTLFIVLLSIISLAAYKIYRSAVGIRDNESNNNDQDLLLRSGAWFALDISMVLNAMTRRGRGLTAFARMQ